MKMYIANCTRQHIDFSYRVAGENGVRNQHIRIGQQLALSGDLNTPQIDDIIKQHAKYGMVAADAIDRTRAFMGVCYSIDKPISVDKITRAMNHNQDVLHTRGQELRREAAVATNNLIDSHLREVQSEATLENLEITIEEENRRDRQSDDNLLREGVIVSKDAPPSPPKVTNRRQNTRRTRAA